MSRLNSLYLRLNPCKTNSSPPQNYVPAESVTTLSIRIQVEFHNRELSFSIFTLHLVALDYPAENGGASGDFRN